MQLLIRPATADDALSIARVVPEGIAHDAGKFDDVVYAFDDLALA